MLLDAVPVTVYSTTADGTSDAFGLTPAEYVGLAVEAPSWVTAFTLTLTTAPDNSSPTPWDTETDFTITKSGITGGTYKVAAKLAGAGVGKVTLAGITGTPGAAIVVKVSREIGSVATGAC